MDLELSGGAGPEPVVIARKLEVTYLPFDRTTRVPPGTTVFSAAHWIGLPIDSTCGGRGTCGKCKVRVLDRPPEVTTADNRQLRKDEIADGWRLSCQAHVHEDMRVEVPQLLRVPKAATMGLGRLVILDPNVRKVYLELEGPTLDDQRADVVAVEAGDTTGDCFGIAFDVGTTTLVGTLMNLRTGMAAAVHSTLNGQAPFGADVISRISHAMTGPDAIRELQQAVIGTMNQVIRELYRDAGVTADRTYEAVVVGNATMLHLLLGVDPTPISMMPFTPAFMEPITVPGAEIGLEIQPHVYLQTLPALGAYVGTDIVAGVQATGIASVEE